MRESHDSLATPYLSICKDMLKDGKNVSEVLREIQSALQDYFLREPEYLNFRKILVWKLAQSLVVAWILHIFLLSYVGGGLQFIDTFAFIMGALLTMLVGRMIDNRLWQDWCLSPVFFKWFKSFVNHDDSPKQWREDLDHFHKQELLTGRSYAKDRLSYLSSLSRKMSDKDRQRILGHQSRIGLYEMTLLIPAITLGNIPLALRFITYNLANFGL